LRDGRVVFKNNRVSIEPVAQTVDE
jgi:hypothetical protein